MRLLTYLKLILGSCALLLLLPKDKLACQGKQTEQFTISATINSLIQAIEQDPNYQVAGRYLMAYTDVREFYEQNQNWQSWFNDNCLSQNAMDLVDALYYSQEEGLDPGDYHLEKILQLQYSLDQGPVSNLALAQLDILLTDAYMLYSSHLYQGKVCPDQIYQNWHVPCRELNFRYSENLAKALKSRTVAPSLELLKPPHDGYRQLKQALAWYRELQGQGPQATIFSSQDLSRVQDLTVIQQRLLLFGDITENEPQFPDSLEKAVNRFKQRHGLKPDGVIDPYMIAWLNVPMEDRINTIKANLERWRWMSQSLGQQYILVNMAGFSLELFDSAGVAYDSKVIIGTPYHSTPAFTGSMTHIILRPYWNIPRSIVTNEILTMKKPKIYLRRNLIQVLDYSNQVVALDSVDWSGVHPGNFPYSLRQMPGVNNALGAIKFVFPNKYAVYIHDTPQRELFKENIRTFSHGCIRLQNPLELASYLLKDHPYWNLQILMDSTKVPGDPIRIDLPKPILVHVLYWTAWIGWNGEFHFRKDIYHRDRLLIEALNAPMQ